MQADPGLVQRMRAAAISVAAGIAASQRAGRRQACQTLLAASLALAELGYCIHFARRSGFIGEMDLRRLNVLEEAVNHHLEPLLDGDADPRSPTSP